jgi:hypothetical protein
MVRHIDINRKVSFIVTSPPPSSLPPSAHTNHKPVCQSAHQPSLSAARKAHYLAPSSPRDVYSAVRAFFGFSVICLISIKRYRNIANSPVMKKTRTIGFQTRCCSGVIGSNHNGNITPTIVK